MIKKRYADSPFDGEGSRLYGSRWSSPGVVVTFASSSRALAILEVMVNLQASKILHEYMMCGIEVPKEYIQVVDRSSLPEAWDANPAPQENRVIGDNLIESGAALALEVPSAVVPLENNYIINPSHPDFEKVEILPARQIEFDTRLMDLLKATKSKS